MDSPLFEGRRGALRAMLDDELWILDDRTHGALILDDPRAQVRILEIGMMGGFQCGRDAHGPVDFG